MADLEPRDLLLLGALAVGLGFGFIGRLSGFCLRSAIIEAVDGKPGRRFAAYAAALCTALLVTQGLAYAGILSLKGNIYWGAAITPVALAVGGLLFGFGMVITRGCGGRHMTLAGGGNLRAWVVLSVLGLTAYATLRGILALPRTWLEGLASLSFEGGRSSLDAVAGSTGTDGIALAIAGGVALLALIAILRLRRQAGIAGNVLAGAVIGLLIPAGWYVTGVLGFDEFNPARVESLTFTAPVGNAIQYLMTYTGSQADFGITAVGGALAGSFVAAILTGSFRLEGFDSPGHLLRYVFGAALMGFGGVLALGCTIGAGLTGMSTLSVGSLIALAGIVAGGAIGHRIKTYVVGGRAPAVVPAE